MSSSWAKAFRLSLLCGAVCRIYTWIEPTLSEILRPEDTNRRSHRTCWPTQGSSSWHVPGEHQDLTGKMNLHLVDIHPPSPDDVSSLRVGEPQTRSNLCWQGTLALEWAKRSSSCANGIWFGVWIRALIIEILLCCNRPSHTSFESATWGAPPKYRLPQDT